MILVNHSRRNVAKVGAFYATGFENSYNHFLIKIKPRRPASACGISKTKRIIRAAHRYTILLLTARNIAKDLHQPLEFTLIARNTSHNRRWGSSRQTGHSPNMLLPAQFRSFREIDYHTNTIMVSPILIDFCIAHRHKPSTHLILLADFRGISARLRPGATRTLTSIARA